MRILILFEFVDVVVIKFWGNLVFIFGIVFVIIVVISVFIVRKIIRLVCEIIEVFIDLVNYKYDSCIYGKISGEF